MFFRLKLILLFLIISPLLKAELLTSASSQKLIRVRIQKDLESFPEISNSTFKKINDSLWLVQGKNLIFKNKKIADQNLIMKKMNQKYDVISVIDFEMYLAGVVASEMSEGWPLEALKAQAVVARSFALAKMKERKNNYFQLEDSEKDQVYKKTNSIKVIKAVQQTQNFLLKSKQGEILKAFYHADCGGQTVPASQVWAGELDTGTAVDPWCQQRKSNEWSYEIETQKFFEKMQTPPESFFETAQVFGLKIQSFHLNETDLSVQKLRQILGFSNIRNSPEKLEIDGAQMRFSGKGYGHGAGLCQRGSFEMARRGYVFSQIIQHYYSEAVLTRNN